jgi:hypothetical protein
VVSRGILYLWQARFVAAESLVSKL